MQFSDDDLGKKILASRIQTFLRNNPTYFIADLLELDKFTSTKTRLVKDDTTQSLFKEFTVVFNAPGTLLVMDFTLPCDTVIPKCTVTSPWRLIHFDSTSKTKTFEVIGTETEIEIGNCFIPSTTPPLVVQS